MKLSAKTFRVQWELHAWAGVITSLWLFVVFYCGVFSLFRRELAVWQEPELASPPGETSFDRVRAILEEAEALPRGAYLSMVPYEGTAFVATYVRPAGEPTRMVWVDPGTARIVPERTRLAHELYHLHHVQQVPFGEEATGVVAVFLLVVLASGLVIHVKDLPAQLVRMRMRERLRLSMSDVHKVLGTLGVPFTTLVVWSGAVLVLGTTFGPAIARRMHDAPAAERLMGDAKLTRPLQNVPAHSLGFDALVARARAAIGEPRQPTYLQLFNDGDASAWARLYFPDAPFTGERIVYLDAVTGDVIPQEVTAFAQVARGLHDFHYGRYGGLTVRIVHALLALLGAIVIVTGNIVWLERRDPERRRRGNRLLERATVGVCCGLVLASAAYAAANRLALPFELRVFYGGWLFAVIASFALPMAPRRLIASSLGASALLFAAVVTSDLLRGRLAPTADGLFIGLSLTALCVFGFAVKNGGRTGASRTPV